MPFDEIHDNSTCKYAICTKYAILLFLLFYTFTLVISAIISPIIFNLTSYFAEKFSSQLLFHFLSKGLGKFFDRSRLITAIITLPIILRLCKIHVKRDLLARNISISKFAKIFTCGFIFVVFIYAYLSCVCDMQFRNIMPGEYVMSVPKFLISAIVIGILEELIFRGIIFRMFEVNAGTVTAIFLSSIFFAYCHLPNYGTVTVHGNATIFDGFKCLCQMFSTYVENFSLVKFLNLTMFGVLLSSLMKRTGSIYSSIAFHAGVVFSIMHTRFMFKFLKISGPSYGSSVGILDTWVTLITQILILLWFLYRPVRKDGIMHDVIE